MTTSRTQSQKHASYEQGVSFLAEEMRVDRENTCVDRENAYADREEQLVCQSVKTRMPTEKNTCVERENPCPGPEERM